MVEIAGINPPGGRDSRISPTHNFREHRRVNYFCARSIFCSPISSFARLKYFLSPSLSSFFFLTWKVWREKEGRNWRFHRGVRGRNICNIFTKGIFLKRLFFWYRWCKLSRNQRDLHVEGKSNFQGRVREKVIRDLFLPLEIQIGGHC